MLKKLLLIDDEVAFTAMLKLFLESTGRYDVAVENNPRKAVLAAELHDPDLILLDVIMPDIEGPDVAFEIRKHPTLRDTPIVFLTATVREDEVIQAEGLIGGHQFIAKLSTTDHLLDSIQRNVNLASS